MDKTTVSEALVYGLVISIILVLVALAWSLVAGGC
jgi:hypothetical protein